MSQAECREVLDANPKQWMSPSAVQIELAKKGTDISINTIRENIRKLAKRWVDIEVRATPEVSPTAKGYRYVPRRTATLK